MNQEEIKAKLKSFICKEIIKKPDYPLKDDQAMISGGLVDSFSIVHIAVFIEKEMAVTIPDTKLNIETMDTLDSIAEFIKAELNSTSAR